MIQPVSGLCICTLYNPIPTAAIQSDTVVFRFVYLSLKEEFS